MLLWLLVGLAEAPKRAGLVLERVGHTCVVGDAMRSSAWEEQLSCLEDLWVMGAIAGRIRIAVLVLHVAGILVHRPVDGFGVHWRRRHAARVLRRSVWDRLTSRSQSRRRSTPDPLLCVIVGSVLRFGRGALIGRVDVFMAGDAHMPLEQVAARERRAA